MYKPNQNIIKLIQQMTFYSYFIEILNLTKMLVHSMYTWVIILLTTMFLFWYTLFHFTFFHFILTVFHFTLTVFHFTLTVFHFTLTVFHFTLTVFHFTLTVFHFTLTVFHFTLTVFHFTLTVFHILSSHSLLTQNKVTIATHIKLDWRVCLSQHWIERRTLICKDPTLYIRQFLRHRKQYSGSWTATHCGNLTPL